MAIGRSLLSAALTTLVVLGSGCTLYQPRPVTFHVRDGDTGERHAAKAPAWSTWSGWSGSRHWS